MSQENRAVGRFFKHSYVYALGNLLNRIGAFLLLPVYTNYLTTTEYGALELFYGVSSVILGVLSMGIAHATLRFYFEYDEQSDRHAVVSTNFIASLVISVTGALLIALWSDELAELVFSSNEFSAGIYIILGTLVFEISSQVCLAYVRAIERSSFFVYLAMAKLVIQVVLNIYFVVFAEMGVIGILLGNFSAVLIGWLILSYFTLSRSAFQFHRKKLIEILKYSFPFLLGTITALVSSNIDKFTLNSLAAVGVYMLARKFGMLIEQLVGEPFSRSYGSFRFSIMKDKNAPLIQANITKYLFYVSLFLALGLSLFIEEFLKIIADEEFRPAAIYVPAVLLASLLSILNYPIQTGILYEKKTKYFFYIGSVAATVSVVANLTLIPVIGIWGACISLILTRLVSIILMHLKSQTYFRVSYHFFSMLLAFISAVAIYAVTIVFTLEQLWMSILMKSILILIYLWLLLRNKLFLNDQERAFVAEFVNKRLNSIRAKNKKRDTI